MQFGKLQEIKFGTPSGAFSLVTDRENFDSQITLTDFESDLVIKHFSKSNIHVGNVRSNRSLSSKSFRKFPSGKIINLNVVYPKPEKTELRLYISQRAGFKPVGGEIWFLFLKSGEIWIGSMNAAEWTKENSILRVDDDDASFQQQLVEDSKIRITKLKGKDAFSRSREIALKRLEKSKYQCEFDSSCRLFTCRSTGRNYVEAHHLIPMSAQSEFGKSLDHVENIFSLCPHCHRAIHHAEKPVTRDMLRSLSDRRPVLSRYGLNISDLTNLYGVEELN